jgi:hypothetical protein
MQKGNERKNVVLLGFLKDLVVMGGNGPSSPGFGAAWAFELDRGFYKNRASRQGR